MGRIAIAWMVTLAGMVAAAPPLSDEHILATAPIDRSDAGLLDFLRKRSRPTTDAKIVKPLVDKLASTKKDEVDKAVRELVALGPSAVGVLRDALKTADAVKVKPRIEDCLLHIEGARAGELVRVVVRRLAKNRPNGVVGVFLSYLPHVEDDGVADDLRRALLMLAIRDGKPDPELEDTALKETNVARRDAAIEIVCQADFRDLVRKLLRDGRRDARLRAALFRLEACDPEAVTVLIDLLAEPKTPEAVSALEALRVLAGPNPPDGLLANPPKREAWAAWWESVTGESLLRYFRERTPDVEPERIPYLVTQLGSKSFKMRQKAESDLVNLRGLSIPHLERALKDDDLEVRRRAERCLQTIRSAPEAPQASANVRLLGLRRPAETAKTLLAFVAFADSDAVVEEVRQALRFLARSDRDTVGVLRRGLTNPAPQRRAVAAEVLAEYGGNENVPVLKKLLGDLEPIVRWRTALGLATRQEREAVPVLIDLLGILPMEQAWMVEEALRRLAGERAPAVPLDEGQLLRQKCRDAWMTWWKDHGESADLAALQRRPADLGLTLVSLWESGANRNWLIEMGRDHKERWKIENLGYVFDFVVLPANRLLMVENTGHRVTERNFKGEVLWEYAINSPINCQKLPNGHVFIVAGDRVVIVDRQKNEVLKFDKQSGLMGGQRFRDGRIMIVNGSGQCFVLDATGAQVSQFQIMGGMANYGGVQELPNGHFLIAQHDRNKVSEYDLEGKLAWSVDTPSPNFATRLPNGHTVIGSQDNRSMIEVDREGKQVSKYEPSVGVWRVRRR